MPYFKVDVFVLDVESLEEVLVMVRDTALWSVRPLGRAIDIMKSGTLTR